MARQPAMSLPADLIVGEKIEDYRARTAARRPKVVYSWVIVKTPKAKAKRDGVPHVRVECVWALKGGNGEHMCGSWPEGFRDQTDAQRSMEACAGYLFNVGNPMLHTAAEIVPAGPKPTHYNGEPIA